MASRAQNSPHLAQGSVRLIEQMERAAAVDRRERLGDERKLENRAANESQIGSPLPSGEPLRAVEHRPGKVEADNESSRAGQRSGKNAGPAGKVEDAAGVGFLLEPEHGAYFVGEPAGAADKVPERAPQPLVDPGHRSSLHEALEWGYDLGRLVRHHVQNSLPDRIFARARLAGSLLRAFHQLGARAARAM